MSKLNNKIVLKYDSYNHIKSKLKRLKAINKYQKQRKETLTTHKDRRKKFKHGLILRMKDATKIDVTKYIIKLEIYYEDTDTGGYGTGNIITVNNNSIYVLTAAHNVVTYDEWYNEWIDASVVAFKYNNKEFVGKASYTCPAYKSKFSKSEYNDIAIIVFKNEESTFSNFTLLPCVVSDKEYLNIETFDGYILGYPGEYNDNIIWGMKGKIKSKKTDNKLCYKIDTTPGQSGSLIFGEIKNGVYGIMGVHTDGNLIARSNCGTKINGAKTSWIKDTILADVINNDSKMEISDSASDFDSTTVQINQSITEPAIIETPTGLLSQNALIKTPKAFQLSNESGIPNGVQLLNILNQKKHDKPNKIGQPSADEFDYDVTFTSSVLGLELYPDKDGNNCVIGRCLSKTSKKHVDPGSIIIKVNDVPVAGLSYAMVRDAVKAASKYPPLTLKFRIKMSNEFGYGQQNNQNERGYLKIKVVAGVELKHRASYCVVRVGSVGLSTREVPRNEHPEWEETLTFKNFRPDKGKKAIVQVFDHSSILKDKKIGECQFEVPTKFNKLQRDTLQLKTSKSKLAGVIILSSIIVPKSNTIKHLRGF